MSNSLAKPIVPAQAGTPVYWRGLGGSALALAVAELAAHRTGLILVIADDAQNAERLETEIKFYGSHDAPPVLRFPDWETLPFDIFSPQQDIVSRRLEALYRLPGLQRGVAVVPINTLIQRLPPRRYVGAYSLLLRIGERLDPEQMRERLQSFGYNYATQVTEHGEFAVRGSLLDIFPMGSEIPYRIDLFDDEVESIRTFDPDSQLSGDKVDSIRILPAREFPLDEEGIKIFRHRYRARFEGNPQKSLIYRDVSNGLAPSGIEYYLPLFFEHTDTLFDYLPREVLVIQDRGVETALAATWQQIEERHEQRRHNQERPLLNPPEVFVPVAELAERLSRFTLVKLAGETATEVIDYACPEPPVLQPETRAREHQNAIAHFISGFDKRVLLVAETAGRREALLEMLSRTPLHAQPVADWAQFRDSQIRLGIVTAALERGLVLDELMIIGEPQLYGERVRQRTRAKPTRDPAAIIRNLTDLSPGAPVVHEEHGVGRYLELVRLEVDGIEAEFLALEYAGGDKLYVPVGSLYLISRYTGSDPDQAPLHKLGSDQWQKAKRKAAERVRDVAAELLDIQARREASSHRRLQFDQIEYERFAAAFPFEETPDQQMAIDAMLADLQSDKIMDRVICGDVGFGKTEVAMRAAFAVVSGGRQVAILVPTTLLAQQHEQNFRDRFADWPVRIETLSRLRGTKEQKSTLEGLAEGKVDIVIGTHKLLQKDMRFKDLGLIIIDEEHRFGVRHKEQLKKLRAEVDILTLTATPIPRTLNMSLAGLRDLSIIATPPVERLAVRTFVTQWDDALIVEACLREIKRGGQVYFLHNKVENIDKMVARISALVPQARVRVAHGQMSERELERVMLDFYHRRFNVLVCTTIIESGIDVPTANTIIINRADHFGLAQLHQLRGRVGRSHHRAYAYLLIPEHTALTPGAVKRLQAFEALAELGSGFMLSTQDLEIRGAGELLGEDQSGQIQEVGFTLYNELLERAVEAIRKGEVPDPEQPIDHGPEVNLRTSALLPEDYMPDVQMRLIFYKRIATAREEQELHEMQIEMIDRFGLLPTPSKHLFLATGLRLKALRLGIRKIEAGHPRGRIIFDDNPHINAEALIQLLQTQPQRYKMDSRHTLRLLDLPADVEQRTQTIAELLDRLHVSQASRPDALPKTAHS